VTYVITDACVRDGACVEVCPVACIHTMPDAAQFYIDPDICIECEQCEVVCPVDAIYLDADLPAHWQPAMEINSSFFRKNKPAAGPVPLDTVWRIVHSAQAYAAEKSLAVAVAVVDGAGCPIVVALMEGARPTAAELALNKAYTAIGFQVRTDHVVSERRQPWFYSLVISSRGRIMAAAGGIPIVDGLAVIGAIGVAGGGNAEQDIHCCLAGLGALNDSAH
jgi:ferredoxin